jgi:flagellar biosynthesis protein FlhG
MVCLGMLLASLLEDQAEGLRRLFVADARRMVASMTARGESVIECVASLAGLLAEQGRKVLVLDEFWAAGERHPVFGVTPRHDLATLMLSSGELGSAVVRSEHGVDLLAGAMSSLMPRPRMEARIGLVNAFYRLTGRYDIVLVNACIHAANHRLSFAWACHDVILLADDGADSATDAYTHIKLLHQADTRRFHLLYRAVEPERAAALFKGLATVSRRHLHLMPEYLGVLPGSSSGQDAVLQNLARSLQAWPMPDNKAGNFPDLMRRLLRGADPHALQTLLK